MIGEYALYFVKMGLAGGIVAADETAVGQVMLSRPIAAGFLTGLIAGNVELGILFGALFELLYIDILPVGGAAFPSAGLAAVSAVSVCGLLGWQDLAGIGGFLPFLFLVSALAAMAGGRAVSGVRKMNERLSEKALEAARRGRFALVGGIHLAGVFPAFLRGFTVVFHVLLAVVFLRSFIEDAAVMNGPGRGLLAAPFAALGIALVMKVHVNRRRIVFFLLGAVAAGTALLVFRV
jgi:mannose/fructose/N-acetylgalactosamine-specific phosphotransferase system component IIC